MEEGMKYLPLIVICLLASCSKDEKQSGIESDGTSSELGKKKSEPLLSAPIPTEVSGSSTETRNSPSYLDKLQYLSHHQHDYILELSAMPDAERFQIIRHPSTIYERETYIMRVGETSSDGKFKINNQLGIASATVTPDLLVTFLSDGRQFRLTRQKKVVIQNYYGRFKLTVDPKEIYVKKGDVFRMPVGQDIKYRLINITPAKAVISYKDKQGKEEKFEIKLSK